MLVYIHVPGLPWYPLSFSVSPVGCMVFTQQSKGLVFWVGVPDRGVAISTFQSFLLGCKGNWNYYWNGSGGRGMGELEIVIEQTSQYLSGTEIPVCCSAVIDG